MMKVTWTSAAVGGGDGEDDKSVTSAEPIEVMEITSHSSSSESSSRGSPESILATASLSDWLWPSIQMKSAQCHNKKFKSSLAKRYESTKWYDSCLYLDRLGVSFSVFCAWDAFLIFSSTAQLPVNPGAVDPSIGPVTINALFVSVLLRSIFPWTISQCFYLLFAVRFVFVAGFTRIIV